jgi:hypothetical protein
MTYLVAGRNGEELYLYQTPLIICKNSRNWSLGPQYEQSDNICRQIPLPFPNLPSADDDPPEWPQDGWSKTLLCIECGQVHVYVKKDVRWWGCVEKASVGQFRNETNCFYVELQCEHKECRTHVKFHVEIFDKTEGDLRREIKKGFVGLWPSCGHPARSRPNCNVKIRDIYLGPIE